MKNPRYTSAAMYTVCATAGPSAGSLIEPTKDSWFVLNRCAITDKITTPNADNTVQNQALPPCYNINSIFFSISKYMAALRGCNYNMGKRLKSKS